MILMLQNLVQFVQVKVQFIQEKEPLLDKCNISLILIQSGSLRVQAGAVVSELTRMRKTSKTQGKYLIACNGAFFACTSWYV